MRPRGSGSVWWALVLITYVSTLQAQGTTRYQITKPADNAQALNNLQAAMANAASPEMAEANVRALVEEPVPFKAEVAALIAQPNPNAPIPLASIQTAKAKIISEVPIAQMLVAELDQAEKKRLEDAGYEVNEDPEYVLDPMENPNQVGVAAASNNILDSDLEDGGFWHLGRTRILQLLRSNPALTGRGIRVAVVDTGINPHDVFGSRLRSDLGGTFLSNLHQNGALDDNGHGTHVAGTVGGFFETSGIPLGAAIDAELLPVKVLDAQGRGRESDILNGIAYAVLHEAKVINLSLGISGRIDTPAWQLTLRKAEGANVLLVAAAGNDSNSQATSVPGRFPTVLCVGASDQNNRRASFSNQGGGKPEIFAPGVRIWSAKHRSRTDLSFLPGTSMATPLVAGLAALLYQEEPKRSAAYVRQRLRQATSPTISVTGGNGSGLIDATRLFGIGGHVFPPPSPPPGEVERRLQMRIDFWIKRGVPAPQN